MGIREFLSRSISRDPRFKEMEQEIRMKKMIEDRSKGADERELERFYEEERQKTIKKNLQEFREARRRDDFSGQNSILKQKNIFKGGKSVMNQDFNILGGKKLFIGKGNSLKGGNNFI